MQNLAKPGLTLGKVYN